MRSRKKHIQLAFIIIFMIMILIPGAIYFLFDDVNEDKLGDKMDKTMWFNSMIFEEKFEARYGLKDDFRKWNASLSLGVFNSSIQPNKTIMGKDDWLFYNDKNDRIFDSYTHRDTLVNKDVQNYFIDWEKKWQNNQMKRRQYIKICWPNKQSIYPEYMSSSMKKNVIDRPSRIEQITIFNNKRNTPLPMYFIGNSMIEHKKKGQLYLKNDSHWNYYGAYYAYSEFLIHYEEILKVKAIPLEEFSEKKVTTQTGDLVRMQGVDSLSFLAEEIIELEYDYHWQEIESKDLPENTLVTINTQAESDLELLIFRDSYCKLLVPMISEHFSKVTYIWYGYNQEIIEKVNPDIIIDAKVERYYD